MTSLRLFFAALLASTLLISCKSLEHVDAKYPTVSQQDAYDLSWGLPPRKARGNPKMRYQYNARAEQAATPSAANRITVGENAAPAARKTIHQGSASLQRISWTMPPDGAGALLMGHLRGLGAECPPGGEYTPWPPDRQASSPGGASSGPSSSSVRGGSGSE